MYSTNYEIEIKAHHGTFKQASEQIINQKKFTSSKRNDHWLGQGIYFFREDYEQAKTWGQSAVLKQLRLGNHEHNQIAILATTLQVHRINFWNLDTREDLLKFNVHIEDVLQKIHSDQLELEISPEDFHKYRCFFCDLIDENIYLLQRTFPVDSFFDKSPYLKNMQLLQHGVQLCVRNPKVINYETIERIIIDGPIQIKTHKGTSPKRKRTIIIDD